MADLLPSTATAWMRVHAALDHARVWPIDTDVIRRAKRPDVCDPSLLPHLAWEFSVDDWSPDWSEAEKREAILAAPAIHRRKGTPWAVEEAAGVWTSARVSEWFEYGGAPYRFRVEAAVGAGETWPDWLPGQLARTAIATKNTRSMLDAIRFVAASAPLAIAVGALAAVKETIRIDVAPSGPIEARPRVAFGLAPLVRERIEIGAMA